MMDIMMGIKRLTSWLVSIMRMASANEVLVIPAMTVAAPIIAKVCD